MKIDHVLAVVPVSDIAVAQPWYQRLFGSSPTNNPMPSLIEWRASDTGWVQVFVDAERAGRGQLNFAVADIEDAVSELTSRGLEPGPIQDVNKGVRLAALTDPDGNAITLIGSFRITY